MHATTETEPAYLAQVESLCETLLRSADYRSAQNRINRFLADANAKRQFIALNETGKELEARRRQGEELTEADIQSFNRQRDTMLQNLVIREFMEAENALQATHSTISRYVAKTLELGRIPAAEDLDSGGCCGGGGGGGGCGCSH